MKSAEEWAREFLLRLTGDTPDDPGVDSTIDDALDCATGIIREARNEALEEAAAAARPYMSVTIAIRKMKDET